MRDELDKLAKPEHKQAIDKHLMPDEVFLLIDCYAPHLQCLMALLFVTGARVSEILYLRREHFPECRRVVIPRTKNGQTRTLDLPIWVQEKLKRHLRTHARQEVFLTQHGKPYTKNRDWGGQFKTATRSARTRAAEALEKHHRHDRAEIMRRFTPHWTRHTFANSLIEEGVNVRDIQAAGGWKTSTVLEEVYLATPRNIASRAIKKLPYSK
jgi:integrase